MYVLTIGTDRKLFDTQSAVAKRAVLYGKHTEMYISVVFSLKSQGFSTTALSPHVSVYPTNSVNRWMYVWDAIRLGKKIVKEQKFIRGESIVTCQDPFECGFVGWRISRYFRLPLHLQLHTDFLSPYFNTSFLQRVRTVLGKFLLPKASGVRVVSKRIADSLLQKGMRLMRPPVVLPIRIDVDNKSVAEIPDFFPQFDFIVCMVSRLEKEKRITDAIDALRPVVTQYPRVGLLVVGDGSQKQQLQRYIEKKGLQQSVILYGWTDEVLPIIKSSDIFLSTSEYEGYGMALIEAGILGTPVVTTDVGVAGDILTDGYNASVCPVGDVACISRAIVELLVHNEKRHAYTLALQESVQKSIPSQEDYVTMYIQNLRDILFKI